MSSENSGPGIDIQQALEILAARSSCQHRRDEEASPNAQNLGQVLDMSGSSDGVPVRRQQVETLQKQHVQKKERAQRQRQLQQKLALYGGEGAFADDSGSAAGEGSHVSRV